MKQVIIALIFFAAGLGSSYWYLTQYKEILAEQQAVVPPGNAQVAPIVQTVNVAAVVAQDLRRQLLLPAELQAYQDVALYPKVQAFVSSISVDRGSVVAQGDVLAQLAAPELAAQRSEAESKVLAAEAKCMETESKILGIVAQREEAEAKLAGDEATYSRLKQASATPGVVAGNEVDSLMRQVEANRARIRALEEGIKAAEAERASCARNVQAARDAADAVGEMVSYLRMTAPFEGVITERNVHPGSLVGPSNNPGAAPMLRLRQVSKLRLVVSVPETLAQGIPEGATRTFTVSASPGALLQGVIRRISRSLEMKTRTMPVELDVDNSAGRLAPGMYAEIVWPVTREKPSLFVPPTSVATTTEKTFVVRVKDENVEWVAVQKGLVMGEMIEVFGDLSAGDLIAVRGTDELRPGT